MTIDVHDPVAPRDLSGVLGYRILSTYNNEWRYEMCVQNAITIDYHVLSGAVADYLAEAPCAI